MTTTTTGRNGAMPKVTVPAPGPIPLCLDRGEGGDCRGRLMSARRFGLDGVLCRRHYDRRYVPPARPLEPRPIPPSRATCPSCGGWKSAHHRWCSACDKVAVRAMERPTTAADTSPPPPPLIDSEMVTLTLIVGELSRLDAAARARVFAFVAARFGGEAS